MTGDDNRQYSDEELGLIVQRASALQDEAREPGVEAPMARTVPASLPTGLTLQAVREIAEEVGVEPRFVDEAAASLLTNPAEARLSVVLGGPMHHEVRAAFAGELTESDKAEAIGVIRRLSGQEGEIREVLGSVEWRSVGRVTGTKVTVEPGAGGGSTVRVRTDASGLAAFTWIGSITAGMVAAGIVVEVLQPGSSIGVAAILGTGGGIGVGLARSIWSRATRALRDRSERLRDELGQYLR